MFFFKDSFLSARVYPQRWHRSKGGLFAVRGKVGINAPGHSTPIPDSEERIDPISMVVLAFLWGHNMFYG